MKGWGAWDWLAFSSIWVAAIVLAADAAIKGTASLGSSIGSLLNFKLWSYIPLICLTLGTTIYLLREFDVLGGAQAEAKISSSWPEPYFPTQIVGKVFRNREVLLDGFSYTDCQFENVTFKYNGTTAVQLSHSKISGPTWFTSDSQAVNGAMLMLKGLKVIGDNVQVHVAPQVKVDGVIHEP
ncbi:hypothetical protein [Methylosinus sp. Ce-a6]|uniref:hypothetical protein n=1 Tax=Methylosinus sp. Ce-a6 TaxID=2172005 RepID=UPI00135C8396|nr:hypothetical protein [Methylosinus sp. Ce-a6]